MNQAAPDVMNALMPIILKNEICGKSFKNYIVGAAGNFEHENDAVNELSEPLLSRFGGIITWKTGGEAEWKSAFNWMKNKWEANCCHHCGNFPAFYPTQAVTAYFLHNLEDP